MHDTNETEVDALEAWCDLFLLVPREEWVECEPHVVDEYLTVRNYLIKIRGEKQHD